MVGSTDMIWKQPRCGEPIKQYASPSVESTSRPAGLERMKANAAHTSSVNSRFAGGGSFQTTRGYCPEGYTASRSTSPAVINAQDSLSKLQQRNGGGRRKSHRRKSHRRKSHRRKSHRLLY